MWVQGIKCRLLSLEANTSTRSPAAGLRNTKGVTDVFSAVYLDGSVEILDIYALTLKQMACRAGEMARKCSLYSHEDLGPSPQNQSEAEHGSSCL